MTKTKTGQKPHYELLYIIANKFTEDEVKPITEKVNKIISDHQGENIVSEEWGKRKLAYPIKGFSHGYYILTEFEASPGELGELNNKMRMNSDVLRFQIIVKDLEKEKKAQKAQKQVKKEEEIKAADLTEKPAIKTEEKKKKLNLEELDKKLDKILDTDDLL